MGAQVPPLEKPPPLVDVPPEELEVVPASLELPAEKLPPNEDWAPPNDVPPKLLPPTSPSSLPVPPRPPRFPAPPFADDPPLEASPLPMISGPCSGRLTAPPSGAGGGVSTSCPQPTGRQATSASRAGRRDRRDRPELSGVTPILKQRRCQLGRPTPICRAGAASS